MTNREDQAPDQTAHRRKEIFRTARGSKLTGLRGRSLGEPAAEPIAGPDRAGGMDDEPLTKRRVRLGPVVEDETDGPAALGVRRYSEPND